MNPRKVAQLMHADASDLDDGELKELIPMVEEEVKRRHRECSKYLGHPCQAGKRKYEAFKEARAIYERLTDEYEVRGLHI